MLKIVLLPYSGLKYSPWANGIHANVHVPVTVRIRSGESDDTCLISINGTVPEKGEVHGHGDGAVSPCLEAT